jgi:hypothetical protein
VRLNDSIGESVEEPLRWREILQRREHFPASTPDSGRQLQGGSNALHERTDQLHLLHASTRATLRPTNRMVRGSPRRRAVQRVTRAQRAACTCGSAGSSAAPTRDHEIRSRNVPPRGACVRQNPRSQSHMNVQWADFISSVRSTNWARCGSSSMRSSSNVMLNCSTFGASIRASDEVFQVPAVAPELKIGKGSKSSTNL